MNLFDQIAINEINF